MANDIQKKGFVGNEILLPIGYYGMGPLNASFPVFGSDKVLVQTKRLSLLPVLPPGPPFALPLSALPPFALPLSALQLFSWVISWALSLVVLQLSSSLSSQSSVSAYTGAACIIVPVSPVKIPPDSITNINKFFVSNIVVVN